MSDPDVIDMGDTIECAWTGELWTVAYVDGDWLFRYAEGDWLNRCAFWQRVRLSECTLHAKATPKDRCDLLVEMANMKPVDEHVTYARARIAADFERLADTAVSIRNE